MSVEALVKGVIEMQMTDLAERVESTFKAVVGKYNKYSRTGEAVGSISILEQRPDYILVGGRNLHLYWLDEGNGRSGKRIYPKHAKALGVYPNGIPGIGWRGAVNAHEAYYVAKQTADKFR